MDQSELDAQARHDDVQSIKVELVYWMQKAMLLTVEIAALKEIERLALECVRPVIPPANEKLWALSDALRTRHNAAPAEGS